MSYIIGNKCKEVKDGACISVCPIDDCIVELPSQMVINPDLCVDCGACLHVCPVDAIYEDEEIAIAEEGKQTVFNNYHPFGFEYE